jgi:MHS family shikimate/dehydroshikimate transporter-like MFS transporter
LPQAASPSGLLLATAVFGLASLLPQDLFLAWGWRAPFLVSGALLAVGLYVRLHVAETPEFLATRPGDHAPIVELLRTHARATALATGARLAETVAGNLVKSFGLTYVTLHLGLGQATALDALVATSAVGLAVTPLYGLLADRFGARTLYLIGTGMACALAVPLFWVLQARNAAAVWIAFVVFYNLGPTLMLSVQATFFAELFAARVRYTGLSFAYQVSAVVGGFTPLAALSLLRWQGGAPWAVAAALATIALLSLLCTAATRLRSEAFTRT